MTTVLFIAVLVLMAFQVYCLKLVMTAILKIDDMVAETRDSADIIKARLEVLVAKDDAEERKLRAQNSNLRRRMGESKDDEDVFPARKHPGLHLEYKGGDNVPNR